MSTDYVPFEPGAPNLDAMSADELRAFADAIRSHHHMRAFEMFPERPEGYVVVTERLKNYACFREYAMMKRVEGNIGFALRYELRCDAIYKGLPDYAKW